MNKRVNQNTKCFSILTFSRRFKHKNVFTYITIFSTQKKVNDICGVMVSMLALNAVDCGFEFRSGKNKDFKIGICYFSDKHACSNKEKEQRLVGSESGYCV